MSGFAEEVKQSLSKSVQPIEQTVEGAISVEESNGVDPFVLPQGHSVDQEASAQEASSSTEPEPQVAHDAAEDAPEDARRAKEESTKERIEIDGYVFESESEALQYLKGKNKALEAGDKQDTEPEQDPVDQYLEQISDKLFEDPKAALTELLSFAVQTTEAKIKREQQQQEQEKGFWGSFYEANQELVGSEEIVNYITQRDWNKVKGMDEKAGSDYLAKEAKKMLSKAMQAAKPKETLSTTNTKVSTTSATPTQLAAPAMEKAVDFVAQLSKLRKRST